MVAELFVVVVKIITRPPFSAIRHPESGALFEITACSFVPLLFLKVQP